MSQDERKVFGALQEIDSQKEYDLINYVDSIHQVIDELESAVNKIEFTVEEASLQSDDQETTAYIGVYRPNNVDGNLTRARQMVRDLVDHLHSNALLLHQFVGERVMTITTQLDIEETEKEY